MEAVREQEYGAMVGVPLRAWREYKGLSQRQLAASAGVGLATIVRIERGDLARPSTRQRLATALGVSHEQLVTGPSFGQQSRGS